MSVITLKNAGKKFIISHRQDGIKGNLFSKIPFVETKEEFWALRNINLAIEEGKIVGILGRNGAGKTTLLNILAGVCAPTEGEVLVKGKVSNLLTLGAGFQEELSGKENIFINASILGMTKPEINKKFRTIAEFSELDGFLGVPVKNYSQGMQMRLGFSIAIHADFDVLLIDEIIAVGDLAFQKKCYEKIAALKRCGKTMMISAQALEIIERLSDEVILLEDGRMEKYGKPAEVVSCYRKLLNEKGFHRCQDAKEVKEIKWWASKEGWGKKTGTNEVKITSVRFLNKWTREAKEFKPGEKLKVKVEFDANEEVNQPHFGVAIFREDGAYCYGPNTEFDGYKIESIKKGKGWFSFECKELLLMPGRYRVSVAIWDEKEVIPYSYHEGYYKIEVMGNNDDGQLLRFSCKFKDEDVDVDNDKILRTISAAFLNEYAQITDTLKTGEKATLRVCYSLGDRNKRYLLKIGIFRDDGVYCHGITRIISGKRNAVSIVYPQMNLLTGAYYVSAEIWGAEAQSPLVHQPRASSFRISFPGKDHGTVYLSHKWRWKFPR